MLLPNAYEKTMGAKNEAVRRVVGKEDKTDVGNKEKEKKRFVVIQFLFYF